MFASGADVHQGLDVRTTDLPHYIEGFGVNMGECFLSAVSTVYVTLNSRRTAEGSGFDSQQVCVDNCRLSGRWVHSPPSIIADWHLFNIRVNIANNSSSLCFYVCLISQLMGQNVTFGSEHQGQCVCVFAEGWTGQGECIGENILYKPSDAAKPREPSVCCSFVVHHAGSSSAPDLAAPLAGSGNPARR